MTRNGWFLEQRLAHGKLSINGGINGNSNYRALESITTLQHTLLVTIILWILGLC